MFRNGASSSMRGGVWLLVFLGHSLKDPGLWLNPNRETENMVMYPAGPETKNDSAGDGQQQFTRNQSAVGCRRLALSTKQSSKLLLVLACTLSLSFRSRGIHDHIFLSHDSGGERRLHTVRVSVSGKLLLAFVSTTIHYAIQPSRISMRVTKPVSFYAPPFPAIFFLVVRSQTKVQCIQGFRSLVCLDWTGLDCQRDATSNRWPRVWCCTQFYSLLIIGGFLQSFPSSKKRTIYWTDLSRSCRICLPNDGFSIII
jgi:hypothetical protein